MRPRQTIYLVDDHVVVRAALKELIEKLGDYIVKKEFDTGKDFVTAAPFSPSPDLLILDLSMPEMDGMEVMKWLRKKAPEIKALVLTIESDDDKIVKLFRLGIRGYLRKNCSAKELSQAIADILNNGYYHNETLAHALSTGDNESKKHSTEQIERMMTDKEQKFLELICNEAEYTYEQIAHLMAVSPRTIDHYRECLFDKFKVKSKSGLLIFAIKNGLVKF